MPLAFPNTQLFLGARPATFPKATQRGQSHRPERGASGKQALLLTKCLVWKILLLFVKNICSGFIIAIFKRITKYREVFSVLVSITVSTDHYFVLGTQQQELSIIFRDNKES